MSDTNVPLINFNGGEIGREAMSRVDLEVYPTCADTMENCFPLLGGGLIKAPGSIICDETPGSAIARVLPFIFDVTDSFVLEFGHNTLRFDYQGGTVQIDGAAASIGTPVNNSSSGGSSVGASGTDITFTGVHEGSARARWPITTGAPGDQVSLQFEITKRALKVKVGTTTTGDQVLEEMTLGPGVHILTFTPGASPYYLQAQLDVAGSAQLRNVSALTAGDLVLPSPYSVGDLPQLKYEQLDDLYWIYHPNYQTRVLERRSNTSWSLRLFAPPDGPFNANNTDQDHTLTPSGKRGTITIAASKATFKATDVGRLVRIKQTGVEDSRTIDAVDEATEGIYIPESGGDSATEERIDWVISGTYSGTIALESSLDNITWSVDDASVTGTSNKNDTSNRWYRLRATAWTSGSASVRLFSGVGSTEGVALITAYSSATSVTAEVLSRFSATSASSIFALGMWSDTDGWPVHGTLHDGRHSLIADNRYWASVSDDYESMAIGTEDADALSRRIGISRAGKARWIAGAERLVIGTIGAELEIRSNALDEPVTPTNNNVRSLNERRGSHDAQPVVANKRICFINRFKNRIYEAYLAENGTHAIDDLTWLHKKIAGVGGFVEIAYQEEPEPRLWCVRADGQLAVMLYRPNQGVYGWARYLPAGTDAAFESVCVIPGATEDHVYVIVKRTVDGDVKRFRERIALQEFSDSRHAVRVQSAVIYEGGETDTIPGLDHLEGETVQVWANGRVHEDCVVTGGEIALNYAVTYAVVGLGYVGKWRSTKLAYGARMGTALTQDKQVERAGLVVYETPVGALGYGRDFEQDEDGNYIHMDFAMGEFQDGQIMDDPVTLVTGEYNQGFDGQLEIDPRICLVMDKPAPVHVQGYIPHMRIEEAA